jgi:hypothetical protein
MSERLVGVLPIVQSTVILICTAIWCDAVELFWCKRINMLLFRPCLDALAWPMIF